MMVMYVSGTCLLSNSGVFCGWDTVTTSRLVTGGTCDFSTWTPGTSMFMFVAGGAGRR